MSRIVTEQVNATLADRDIDAARELVYDLRIGAVVHPGPGAADIIDRIIDRHFADRDLAHDLSRARDDLELATDHHRDLYDHLDTIRDRIAEVRDLADDLTTTDLEDPAELAARLHEVSATLAEILDTETVDRPTL